MVRNTLTRAQRLSLASTSVQGEISVLVRSTMSPTAAREPLVRPAQLAQRAPTHDDRGEREQDNDALTQRYHAAFIDSIWQLSGSLRWQLGLRYDQERYTNADMLAPRTQLSWQ